MESVHQPAGDGDLLGVCLQVVDNQEVLLPSAELWTCDLESRTWYDVFTRWPSKSSSFLKAAVTCCVWCQAKAGDGGRCSSRVAGLLQLLPSPNPLHLWWNQHQPVHQPGEPAVKRWVKVLSCTGQLAVEGFVKAAGHVPKDRYSTSSSLDETFYFCLKSFP